MSKSDLSDIAIVVGYDGFGRVPQLTASLRRHGFHEVFALVNNPSMVEPLFHQIDSEYGTIDPPHLVKIDNILSCYELAAAVKNIAGENEVPFLCLQDRPMFAYISARHLLFGNGPHRYHVPDKAILRARIKPSARLRWKWSGIEKVKWTVLTDDPKTTSRWGNIGGLSLADKGAYIVKPICGMGSEMVKTVLSKHEAYAWAAEIRRYFEKHEFWRATEQSLSLDGELFDLYTDVLVEEKLEGAEYTLDGCSMASGVAAVAQHKETIFESTFFGDGAIYCPPDNAVIPSAPDLPLKFTGPNRTTNTRFEVFAKRAVQALQLTDWFFHGEMCVDKFGNISFIELNPRVPGGLLWKTAGIHLGVDPTECIVRFHLRMPVEVRRQNCVTVQFPIYAEREGVIDVIEGIDIARALPCAPYIVQAVSHRQVIEDVRQENYVAFVCIEAPTHEAARQAESEVRKILKVKYI